MEIGGESCPREDGAAEEDVKLVEALGVIVEVLPRPVPASDWDVGRVTGDPEMSSELACLPVT